ncbi:MAG: TrmH family RNA methyltransferase [Bacteroidales bacterium]
MPDIHFILYKPGVPGNVGAAARAMKTMGFRRLDLIDPCPHLGPEARMLAHGSGDILEQARVFQDFGDMAAEFDLVLATTAKSRTAKHEYHSSREVLDLLKAKASSLNRVGVLFGTEESGLPNELILRSDAAVSIPMATDYPSLNLAQAVMVMAYELAPLNALSLPGEEKEKSGEGYGHLKSLTSGLLSDVGIPEGSPLHHRILERLATVGNNDIPLLLSIAGRINHKED